ncbi:MAG: DUF169 domain-containing protein [Oscillospiraceae bacterium]|nr:DUF169 domain-containing protein [Oscillospiraceae bacterium]
MKMENVKRLELALGLQRKIVGVKFLYNWAEYQDAGGEPYDKNTRFCVMVKRASEGGHYKCCPKNFACGRSRRALGIEENDPTTYSGEVYYSCGLYATRAVAKRAQKDTIFIRQQLYGIEIAPLEELSEADVVIFFGDAYQLMRVAQGYAYQYGAMKNIGTVGNQGVCSDLCARPFETNDINVSFLCEGTRRACGWTRNDIGVGLPVNLFDPLTEGVLATLNLIETAAAKEEILARLDSPDALGVDIDPGAYYGVSCGKWYQKRADDQRRWEEHLKEEEE